MTFFRRERSMASQIGYCASFGSAYTVGAGDIAFAGAQYILWRHTLPIPKGSTVQNATLKINVIAMKNSAQAQTCYNSVRAVYSGDSPLLIPGDTLVSRGPWTAARQVWTMVWPVSPPDLVYMTLDVKPIIDEIMAHPEYKSEGYITFMLYTDNENGSDMGMRANNGFFIGPQLEVNYTEPATVKTTFNHHENPVLDATVSTIEANKALGLYEQNEFFGGFVAAANQGSIVKDTSFTRTQGIPTLRFTCGTKDPDINKRTGWTYPFRIEAASPVMFTCWLYISSAIPTTVAHTVQMGDVYVSMQNVLTRGVWFPFCTPIMNVAEAGTRWWTIGVRDYQPGWQFWMSEPAIIYGNFKQMPFIGVTPAKDPDIVHRASLSKQMSAREWTPRRNVPVNGAWKNYPSWTMRSDGIFVLSEPIKGGPQINLLGSTPVGSLPAGKTINEL